MVLSSPVFAQQDPVLALRDASQQIDAATAALAVASEAEDRVVALSTTIRSLESGMASLRLALLASKQVEAEKLAAMTESRADLGNLLAILAALENTPSPLTVMHPDGAAASARAGIILAAIAPKLQERADSLRSDLTTISALNALHDQALGNLQLALTALQSARNELTIAIREERPAPSNPAESNENLNRLLRASEDLNALASRLGTRLPGEDSVAPTQQRHGKPSLPMSGILTRGYNMPNGAGIRQPGIVITAPPLSLVTAPLAGVVRFTGDFLEYGQVVILESAPEELQIYAGFGQVYVNTGDVLESGAAMGLLGGEVPDSAEFLAESTGENDKGLENLYIEIRENGIPVDPTTWFAAN